MYSTKINSKNVNNFGAESFSRTEFNQMIQELVNLHKRGILTDVEFEKLIRISSASFIEREISNKVNKSIEEKLFPQLFGGLKLVR
jgi:hypothetical protein